MQSRVGVFKRAVAKIIDYSLVALLLHSLVWTWAPFLDPIYVLLALCTTPLFSIPLQALQLKLFKTTLGNAVMGFLVHSEGGGPLTLKKAFYVALSLSSRASGTELIPHRSKILRLSSLALCTALIVFLTLGLQLFPSKLPSSDIPLSSGWVRFYSDENKFTVDFPQDPECFLREFPVPPAGITLAMTEYLAKASDAEESYSLSYVTLPRSWLIAPAKKILQGALYLSYETALGSDVLTKRMTTHHGKYPAIDFIAKQNGQWVQGRILLSHGKLYQVSKRTPLTPATKPSLPADTQEGAASQEITFIDSFAV